MPEAIVRTLYFLEVHLLFASLVWFEAWMLTSLGPGSATTKYWLWIATELNFIVPVSAVIDALWAPHLSWATPLTAVSALPGGLSRHALVAALLGVVWLLGAALMLTRLCLRIRADRREGHGAAGRQVPAVSGLLRPRISLPDGIDRLLSEDELQAVLIHEATHVRRRDNLIRLVHEVGLCALWFHPLVWITGARLALYRELSCDESVIERGHHAELVSALAKLANPEDTSVLQASASSFLTHRLARLTADQPRRVRPATSALLAMAFGAVILTGVFETVAHTACCFVAKA